MEETIKIMIQINDTGNLLAKANLMILTKDYGWLNIKDFHIWKSRRFNTRLHQYINIQPPSFHINGKYIPKLYFEDKNIWSNIEQEIYIAYTNEKYCREKMEEE